VDFRGVAFSEESVITGSSIINSFVKDIYGGGAAENVYRRKKRRRMSSSRCVECVFFWYVDRRLR